MRYFEPHIDKSSNINSTPKLPNPQAKLKVKIGLTAGIKNPQLLGNALKVQPL